MESIRLLFVITHLIKPTQSAPVTSRTNQLLWNTQSRWCTPQQFSCINKFASTTSGAYSQSSTDTNNNTTTQQGNQSSSDVWTDVPVCCGFCSCESDCAEYGTCCLMEFRNLQLGKKLLDDATAKYECVRPQLITSDKMTDLTYARGFESTWMVSKCPASSVDTEAKSKCANPGINGELASIVPVTDFSTHYRNKYCARCNGAFNVGSLLPWGLKLNCMQYFKFGGENILQRIVRHRCNIFFKPPRNAMLPRACIPHSDTISRCNVTGLWPKYNKTIDLACSAYMDVFNASYKNIFCFLCNTNEVCDSCLTNNAFCHDPRGSFIERTPLFSTTLDVDILKDSDINSHCGGSFYFKDDKMSVCYNISCDPTRELSNHLCLLRETTVQPLCYVLYIKFTPDDITIFNSNNRDILPFNVEHLFDEETSPIHLVNSYFKPHKNWRFAHYGVMELLVKFYSSGIDFISILIQKYHNKWHDITNDLKVWSEFVIATHQLLNNTMYLSVRDNVTEITDILDGNAYTQYVYDLIHNDTTSLCGNTGPVILDHLHVCPFIRLNLADINVTVKNNNNSLLVKHFWGNNINPYITIPDWEFRMRNESVLICLSTYRQIYTSILTISAASGIGSDDAKVMEYVLYMALLYATILVVDI